MISINNYIKSIMIGFTISLITIITFQQLSFLISTKNIDETQISSNFLHGFKPVKEIIKQYDDNKTIDIITTNNNRINARYLPRQHTFIRGSVDSNNQSNNNNVIIQTNKSIISNQNDLTIQQCQKFGIRKFLNSDTGRLPPMLYTFPGSGNTWCRLLIEHASKIYTGSVYNDRSLLPVLPGEFSCNLHVSVVKVHPHTHPFRSLYDGTFHSDGNKCAKGRIKSFKKAILLIRNPFDSIWSEYQRRVTNSHVDGIVKQTFDWHRWQANAAAMSHSYYDMWNQHYSDIERLLPKENILYIKYEDLKNKDKRVEVLNQVMKFLKLNISIQQLQCAYILAENKKAHREIDKDIEMTKDVAYTYPLACRMWNLFGSYAEKHGYQSFNGYNCSGIPKMPKGITVGAAGQYGPNWVSPGDKLVDFGGLPKVTKPVKQSSSNSNKKVARPEAQLLTSFHSKVSGMTIDEAMSVNGIGKLGEDNPVWL